MNTMNTIFGYAYIKYKKDAADDQNLEIIMNVYNLLNCLITERPKMQEHFIYGGLLQRAFELNEVLRNSDTKCKGYENKLKLIIAGYARKILQGNLVQDIIHIIHQYYIWYPTDKFVNKMGFANYTKIDEGKAGLRYCTDQAKVDTSWYWPIHNLCCINMGYPEKAICLALWRMVNEDESHEPLTINNIYTLAHKISVEDPLVDDNWEIVSKVNR